MKLTYGRFALVAVLSMLLTVAAVAKAGPEIPLPAEPLTVALEKAQTALAAQIKSEPRYGEKDLPNIIATKVEYSDEFIIASLPLEVKKLPRRCWVVTFVDRLNDEHEWVYAVDGGRVELIARW